MKTKALKAWLASLPLALLPPLVIWTCVTACIAALNQSVTTSDLFGLGLLLGYSGVVHFTAYLITGLPIFLLQFGKPDSTVWTLPGAIISGIALGGLPLGFFGIPQIFLIGIPYGVITAIAAYRQRPYHHENAHHLP